MLAQSWLDGSAASNHNLLEPRERKDLKGTLLGQDREVIVGRDYCHCVDKDNRLGRWNLGCLSQEGGSVLRGEKTSSEVSSRQRCSAGTQNGSKRSHVEMGRVLGAP